jgi:hypothetical protein
LRVGVHRDGSRTGVLAYAQEHAREWVTPLVTIETAERLLRNYGRDRATTRLLREGHDEALEYAGGLIAMIGVAADYQQR